MDAVQGYFQIVLTDAASKLTTFLLPWGKLRYLRGPMGLCSTNDIWCLLLDYVIFGFPWTKKIVNNILTLSPGLLSFLLSQLKMNFIFLLIAKLDDDYQAVISAFWSHSTIDQLSPSHAARVYKNIWDELSLIDDGNEGYLLTWGDRIVIPLTRNEILARLHFSHQGLTKMSLAAKSSYHWPGMNNDLKTLIASCTACQKYQASEPSEPLQSYTLDQTFLLN
ncbi:hypothetical protein TCAL_15475 [Tigriopus californicus]|uniref:RNA-directed DNA polymerase n=1 Tax=Tigriopus californicus TaxID=6832 RepID=A0A553PRJ4_TIGCA|nr:hypothetical protein TCAL_15475 [Tigriopus californicus]